MTWPNVQDVDNLRRKLRSLGYLDAGVDRFVLGPARQSRSVAAIAVRSSVRIGLLAALLLGPAIGIGANLPGLITGPRDALLVAGYLSGFFALGATGSALLAAGFVALLAKRWRGSPATVKARRLPRLAGGAVGIACLLYLTLWWDAAASTPGWGPLLDTTVALGAAVAVSWLLGHAASMTALAVIAHADLAHLPPRTARRTWAQMAAAGAAFGGAATLLLWTSSTDATTARNPISRGYAVVPTGMQITLVGIDGFDLSLYERLAADAALPNLQAVLDGARARLAAPADRDPVRAWTSLATGQPAEVHGLEGLETRRIAGMQGTLAAGQSRIAGALSVATDLLRFTRPSLATSVDRQSKTLWEVVSENGLRTAVVNWWATWPAPADARGGIVVSDRAALRLDLGGALAAEIAPPQLYDALLAEWPALRSEARRQAATVVEGTTGELADLLRRSAALDALQVGLASHHALGTPELLALYLPGLDIFQQALLEAQPAISRSAARLAQRIEALEHYYGFLDRLLEPLLTTSGRDDLVAIVTHPGRDTEASDSLFSIRGHDAHSHVRTDGTMSDVAPTILYALGFPISQELPGAPKMELFTSDFVARHPVRTTISYGRRARRPSPQDGSTLEDEMLERLRSLGYVR